ncbi:MAG: heme lyase CcmF/NrfE family subunit, partial [Steroidobacteraceae bacterium]
MIPELGQFTLILAMLLAALQAFFGIVGPAMRRDRWMAAVTPAVSGQCVMVAASMGCLVTSFVMNDFSVAYVAQNSNSALPVFYRVAAVWGAHSGSLILWIFLLACWSVAAAIGTSKLPKPFAARVLGVLGLISFGFLLYTLATSNPFLRLDPPWPDGESLNPILQDPGLAGHPPILYTGYVGLAVAFAFAGAAMLEGRLDREWARWTRPWTTAAWAFLSCGIALGSWWAYYTLGWGGFWFWDPVENASFMPWLMATALIHSLAVTEKRGLFKSWTLLLAVLAFSLSLVGTFLVRSGVLVSVHSFAASPTRGTFILAFLIVMIGGALALYAWRAPLLKSEAGFELTARESFLLFNNILLVTACATVFAGTIAPLISSALGLGKLSVGPPYFNPTFLLSMLPLLALLPVGIHARWKRGKVSDRARPIILTLIAAAVIGCAVVFGLFTGGRVLAPVGVALGIWIIFSSLIDPIDRLRRHITIPRAVLGMTLAHIGLGIFVISITSVEAFTAERDVALAQGQTAQLGAYDFRFEGVKPIEGPNYGGVGGTVIVTRNGSPVGVMYPEKREYWVQHTVTTASSIRMHYTSNILVALGQDLGDGRWSLRLQVRPLVTFIWLAALIMAAGGMLAISDRRYRLARAEGPAPAPMPAA